MNPMPNGNHQEQERDRLLRRLAAVLREIAATAAVAEQISSGQAGATNGGGQ